MTQSIAADISPPPQCRVLIVDDDPDALEAYCEYASGLGYDVVGAPDPGDALRLLASGDSIGIVVTDLEMPAIGGIAFLDEVSSRFSMLRPIVSIVITGHGSLDKAVEAMRFNAKDFLTKPVSAERLAEALRRATRTWRELYAGFQPAGAAAAAVPEASPPQLTDLSAGLGDEPAFSGDERVAMLAQVRAIIRRRETRAKFLDPQLFADPSWDILLDLTVARLEGKPTPVSSACAATNVPLSTALRYVRNLVNAGMVRRWKDVEDRRRDLLELEDSAMASMARYLGELRARRHRPS